MARRRCLPLVAVLVWLSTLGTPPAGADVNLAGSWELAVTGMPLLHAVVAQQGDGLAATLDSTAPARVSLVGTIDQATGSFVLDAMDVIQCSSIPVDTVVLRLSGTATVDSAFTGTLEAVPVFPGATCAFAPRMLTATRLSAVCGNGVADGAEGCDPGPPPALDTCCTLTCSPVPAGTECPSDDQPCTVDACDGAGTCTHAAGNAGAVCRASGPPCDVAETCDGVSAACPADQPTCPPPDIDATGTWRVTVQSSFFGPVTFDMPIVQTGTSLMVNGIPGWLDPVSRAFQATRGAQCPVFGQSGSHGFTGTFAAGGASFTGTSYSMFEKITPPAFCVQLADPATGVRIATPPCDPGDPDTDGDGVPDPCDACVGGPPAVKPRLQVSTDKLRVSGRAQISGSALDPVATGLRLLVTTAAGGTYLDVIVPRGSLLNGTGWRTVKSGWRFSAPAPVAGAVSAVTLKLREEGTRVDFQLRGKRATLPALPADLPLRATVVFDPPQSATGLCTDASFPGPTGVAPSCALKRGGAQVSCR